MEKENTNSENPKRADMPVFHEYSNNKPGLPFISITSALDGKRIVIGRIHREYDNETQRAVYTAFDGLRNPIFTDIPDLVSIKKEFINEREALALFVWKNQPKEKEIELGKDESREAGLKETRERNKIKNQTKKIER